MITMKPKIPVTYCPKHGVSVPDKNGNCRACVKEKDKKDGL